jgi:hypothetical protein
MNKGKTGTVTYFRLLQSHLSLGLRTLTTIPLISATPHLSGPWGPATNLSQLHPRCITNGIMAKAGGDGKGFAIFDLRFMICDWGGGRAGRPDYRIRIGQFLPSSLPMFLLSPCILCVLASLREAISCQLKIGVHPRLSAVPYFPCDPLRPPPSRGQALCGKQSCSCLLVLRLV